MDKKRTWIWFVRGFELAALILLGFVVLAWPALGRAQTPGEATQLGPEPQAVGDVSDYTSPLVIPAADFSSDGADPDGFRFNSAG
jgi:hypothetical protein